MKLKAKKIMTITTFIIVGILLVVEGRTFK